MLTLYNFRPYLLNSSTLITIEKYWQILLKVSQFQTSAFLPLLRTHKQTGMAHFATALFVIRHWHFWDSNLQMLCCPMLPVCPRSIVLFEVSHALPACPVKWSTQMKQYEAVWSNDEVTLAGTRYKSGDQPPDLWRDTWREILFYIICKKFHFVPHREH